MPKRPEGARIAEITPNWELLHKQRALWDAQEYLVAYVGGYGSGKTQGGIYKALELCSVNQGCSGGIVAQTFGKAKEVIIPTMKSTLDDLGVEYSFSGSVPMHFDIPLFKTTVWILSGDNPDSIKGPTWAWAWIDEPFSQSIDVYLQVIARLRDSKANRIQLVLSGTPEELNWGYDLLRDCIPNGAPVPIGIDSITKRESRGLYKRLIQVRTDENKFLPASYIQSLEAQYDEQMLKAYKDGEFVPLTRGVIYYNFDRVRNVVPLTYEAALLTSLCFDFNVDPMTVLICQDKGKEIRVIGEVSIRGSNTHEAALTAKQRLYDYGWTDNTALTIYGDPAGASRSTRSGQVNQSDYDIIRAVFPSAILDVARAAPAIRDRYNAVNALFKNAAGEINLLIDPQCQELIKDFLQCHYKQGTLDIATNDRMRGHKADALGYKVWQQRLKVESSVAEFKQPKYESMFDSPYISSERPSFSAPPVKT